MSGVPSDIDPDFIPVFFEETDRCFGFLQAEHGFERVAGFAVLVGAQLVIKPFDEYKQILAKKIICRYEKDQLAIELMLAHNGNLVLQSFREYNGTRFSLVEMFHLMDQNLYEPLLTEPIQLICPGELKLIFAVMEENLRRLSFILKTDEQAKKMMDMKIESAIREQYKTGLEYAQEKGREAWLQRDYISVIRWLTPYESGLGETEKKTLAMARKKIIDPIR